jgi:hypothetical protein
VKYWCWLAKSFTKERIAGEYFWFWLTLGVSVVLYFLLFLLHLDVIMPGASWYAPTDPKRTMPPVRNDPPAHEGPNRPAEHHTPAEPDRPAERRAPTEPNRSAEDIELTEPHGAAELGGAAEPHVPAEHNGFAEHPELAGHNNPGHFRVRSRTHSEKLWTAVV